MGLVSQVFSEESLAQLTGNIAIGHNRYSTTGSSRICNAQPMVVGSEDNVIAIAHNGNIVNSEHLYKELSEKGYNFQSSTDSEVIANLIHSAPGQDWVEKIRYTMKRIRGAYSLVIMTKDTLFAVRDPFGVRPLSLGENQRGTG